MNRTTKHDAKHTQSSSSQKRTDLRLILLEQRVQVLRILRLARTHTISTMEKS